MASNQKSETARVRAKVGDYRDLLTLVRARAAVALSKPEWGDATLKAIRNDIQQFEDKHGAQ